MNKLQSRYQLLVLLFWSIFIISCKNTESDIGGDFFQSHSSVLTIDTLTASLQTVYLDSISTAGTGVILAGSYNDDVVGKENISSYLQVGAPSVTTLSQAVVFDSLCLIIKPNHYYLGDTTQIFQLAVHQLNAILDLGNNYTFYNTTSFPYDANALGSWSGRLFPNATDSVSIRLPDQLGHTFLDAIINNPNSLSSDNLFINNYCKGIVITAENNNNVFGFTAADTAAYMRLYTHYSNDAKSLLPITFPFTNSNLQFNHVEIDRSGTAFNTINSNNKVLSAEKTNDQSVTQPLANMAIRINFPYLGNLQLLGRYSRVLNAQLILQPTSGSYAVTRPLPPAIALCPVIDYYTVEDSVTDINGLTQHGNLITDYAYNNSYYTYDITSYLAGELAQTNNNNKTQLLLIPPSPAYNTTLQRLVINNAASKYPGIQVKVQLLLYNE